MAMRSRRNYTRYQKTGVLDDRKLQFVLGTLLVLMIYCFQHNPY